MTKIGLFDLLFSGTALYLLTASDRKRNREIKRQKEVQKQWNAQYVEKAKQTNLQTESSPDGLSPFGVWPFVLLQMEWQDDIDLVKFLENSKAYYGSDYNSIFIDTPYEMCRNIIESTDDVKKRIEKHVYEHEKRRLRVGVYYPPVEPPFAEKKEQEEMELDAGKLADEFIDKIKEEFNVDENGEIRSPAKREILSINMDDGMFTGECINGIPNGDGAVLFPNGRGYRGEWLNGKWHGFGVMTFSSNDIYEGMFENGKMHGKGKLTYANGTYYEGEFWRNEMRGTGTLYSDDGRIFAGQFANDLPNGRVIISIPDGPGYKRYIGEVKDGIPHGNGKVVANGKLQYDGYWANGKPVGGSMINETASRAPVPAPIPIPDSTAELRKYKQLLDDGIITQDDFDAKKRQLLGL